MFDLSISIIGSNKEPINIYSKELEILPVYLQTCEWARICIFKMWHIYKRTLYNIPTHLL